MSQFECRVVRAEIIPHPNANAIEICRIGDFQSIVKKGMVNTGDLVVYIPEQAILPVWLMKEMGLWDEVGQRGTLSGGARNRVKAVRLRGVVSQGLVLPGVSVLTGESPELCIGGERVEPEARLVGYFLEGMDAAEFLSIVKYEPTLPSHMAGRALGVDMGATHNYDFDNLKKMPNMFDDGEPVVISEKIHGTFLQVCVVPTEAANERYYAGRVAMTSKGLGGKGIILDHNDESNLYAQTVKKLGLMDKVLSVLGPLADDAGKPQFIFGEVFGRTASGACVQDLTYTDQPLDYRAFDICSGNRGTQEFAPLGGFTELCALMDVPTVPVLYVGPYSKEVVLQHTDGKTTLGAGSHIREGVVVKSANEAVTPSFQRKIAKSVSDAYLLRTGDATEFN